MESIPTMLDPMKYKKIAIEKREDGVAITRLNEGEVPHG